MLPWAALLVSAALATEAAPEASARNVKPDVWSPRHPVQFGLRGGVWRGDYTALLLGGHLRFRPFKRLGLEGWTDHAHSRQGDLMRHDWVVGAAVFAPIIGGERFSVGPSLGACANLRVTEPHHGGGPSAMDIRIAGNAGAIAELYIVDGVSLQANATAYLYVGNDSQLQGWSAVASNDLHLSPVFQGLLAVNYAF